MIARRFVVLGMVVLLAAMLGRMGWVDWVRVGDAGMLIAFCLIVLVVILLCLATPFLVIGGALWLLAEVLDAIKADPLDGVLPTSPKRASPALKAKERSLSDQLPA